MFSVVIILCVLLSSCRGSVTHARSEFILNSSHNWPARVEAANHAMDVKIVGGRKALSGEIPHHMVLLTRSGPLGRELSLLCGGSLIADQWVITAAHCVWNSYSHGIAVAVGINNLRDINSHAIAVQSIHTHPGYFQNERSQEFDDIALLKLQRSAFALGTFARAISLPIQHEENNFHAARVSGFGDTKENGAKSESLKVATILLRSRDDCETKFQDEFNPKLQICAGLVRGINDTCQGDSGGPLFASRADGSNVLLGITSFGNGCGRRLSPGVYTKVSQYLPWIRQTIFRNLE